MCGRIAFRLSPRSRQELVTWEGPVRSWRLVLLDDDGLGVGVAGVRALRPGWAPSAVEPGVWEPCPTAVGDGELPSVVVFHRLEDGRVVRG